MATSQDFVNWVCSDTMDYRYLKYVLLAEHDTFLSFASGTTHQTIYYPEVKAFHVCLPRLEIQHRIAAVLGAIDDLIENNRRRIELLEQMAQGIYREWFVHLRYPGHEDVPLVDSPLRPIPEGWEAAALQDLVQLVTTSIDPRAIDPLTPAVGLEHIPRRQLTLDAWGMPEGLASRKLAFDEGDRGCPEFRGTSVAVR